MLVDGKWEEEEDYEQRTADDARLGPRLARTYKDVQKCSLPTTSLYLQLLIFLIDGCSGLAQHAIAMKVIGFGAGRTGTESLKVALIELGFGPTPRMWFSLRTRASRRVVTCLCGRLPPAEKL